MDEKKSYLHICVDKAEYDRIMAILTVFAHNGYFDLVEKTEIAYDAENCSYSICINGMRSCKTAWLIGDILEASVGRCIEWFHYSEDPEDDER